MPTIDFSHLAVQERLELIGELWDSLDDGDVPVPADLKAELDRRSMASRNAAPGLSLGGASRQAASIPRVIRPVLFLPDAPRPLASSRLSNLATAAPPCLAILAPLRPGPAMARGRRPGIRLFAVGALFRQPLSVGPAAGPRNLLCRS